MSRSGRLKAFAAIGVSLAVLWVVAILMLASGPDGAAPAASAENGDPAAYGYSGDDPDQYTAGVNQAVIPDPFYESPGAAYVEEFARRVESGGTRSTATLQDFEITEVSGERAEGVARFTIEDPSGTRRLVQELHVRRLGAIWRVSGAGIMEEV
jgi:hypothetical protein